MIRAASLLAAAFSLTLTGCAAILQTYGGKPPAPGGPEKPPTILPEKDYRGIIHCHSCLSHDCKGSEETIVKAATEVGIDFIIMTDHYDRKTDPAIREAIRGKRENTLFIPGVELRKDGGSLLALGVEQDFDPKMSSREIAEEIHRQGGLIFIGHLEEFAGSLMFLYDGIEIFNLHTAAKSLNPFSMIFRAIFLPPQLVFKSLCKPRPENFEILDNASENRAIPICAGNDAHANVRIFGPFGGTIGTYEEIFRTVTTHIWAKELTKESVLNALKTGRCYISFDAFRDATGFWYEVVKDDKGKRLKIFSPEISTIVLLQKGKVIAEAKSQHLESPALQPGIYRIEISLGEKPWILSSPIQIH